MRQKVALFGMAALCGLALACVGQKAAAPTTPTNSATANSDGSTLKVSAPGLSSPVGGVQLQAQQATLVVSPATPMFGATVPLSYRVQVMNSAGSVVEEQTGTGTTYVTKTQFDVNTLYKWRARAESSGVAGPWSTVETFKSQDKVLGYIKGSEIYDPLTEGVTVGQPFGDVTFIPGVGAHLGDENSYIQYQLPVTLVEGEYSALMTGLSVVSATEDPKNRVMTMREGDFEINDNIYRMSVDVRGNGDIAWRFLTGPGPYIETVGAERVPYSFHEALTYFVQATWRDGFFNVIFREGGVNGEEIYNFGKAYDGIYQPLPHMVFAGSPYQGGDRGDPSSYAGMTIRQIWVSANPRPSFANK